MKMQPAKVVKGHSTIAMNKPSAAKSKQDQLKGYKPTVCCQPKTKASFGAMTKPV